MPAALGLLQILAVGLFVYWLFLVVSTVRSLTRPPRRSYAWALARGIPGDPGECDEHYAFETFNFRAAHGDIECWRVRGERPEGPVVVMTHGWGSSKQGGLKRLAGVVPSASEVLLWDLPGHGDSAGNCALGTNEHRDLCALIETIEKDKSVILFGWSMGAGVSLRAAHESNDHARILCVLCEAPYIHAPTPARNVIHLQGFPTRFNLAPAFWWIGLRLGVGVRWRGFARDRIAGQLHQRVIVYHGENDPVCPWTDGETIARASRDGRFELVSDAGHNNLWTDARFRDRVAGIVRDALGSVGSTESL
ncbi:MAG: alpha/beta hydrolase [Phycisphaerales bacterium]|nr:alpha/beta hydrolase [Phycisphaerales bacterium]